MSAPERKNKGGWAVKRQFGGFCFAALFLGMFEVAAASGIDSDANAKSTTISFREGFSVRAEVDHEGGLGLLRIDVTDGKPIQVAKEELAGLEDVDLQTLKVRLASATKDDATKRLFDVSLEYGDEVLWRNGVEDVGKLYVRSCVRFVFLGDRLVARYRAVPAKKEAEWMTFVKVAGKADSNDEIMKGRGCPFSNIGRVEFFPEAVTRPSGAGHEKHDPATEK